MGPPDCSAPEDVGADVCPVGSGRVDECAPPPGCPDSPDVVAVAEPEAAPESEVPVECVVLPEAPGSDDEVADPSLGVTVVDVPEPGMPG